MGTTFRPAVQTGNGANLAFAIVVLTSYLATFSTQSSTSSLHITLLILLGIAYLAIGVYGYAFSARATHSFVRLGYFVIQIWLGGCIVYLGRGAGMNALILLPLAGHSVLLLAAPWLYIVNGTIAACYALAVWFYSQNLNQVWNSLPVFLAGIIFIMIFTQMALGEEKARIEANRLFANLDQANHRLREYSLQVEELAITKERNRLAREIHDGLGHYLTTINIQIQASLSLLENNIEKARVTLEKAQTLTQDALEDVRHSVASLRSAPDENLPLPDRIEKIIKSSELAGIGIELSILGKPRSLTSQTQLTLYRAVQEGLNNTCKHAKASKAWVSLDYSDEKSVGLTIRDNGVGADHLNGGFGLLGLQERVHLLHGELETKTLKSKGFTLMIKVPG